LRMRRIFVSVTEIKLYRIFLVCEIVHPKLTCLTYTLIDSLCSMYRTHLTLH
jgi:hypothetical protein